jgi:16S rRNA (cytidine1402-2'-O)-methyltransferase
MARELTKLHEEVVRGPLTQLAEEIGARESLKGEVVLLVGPPVPLGVADEVDEPETVDEDALRERVSLAMAEGMTRTAAVKHVAKELGVARGTVYDAATRS